MMKIEGTEESIIQEAYDGESPQAQNKVITHVIVGNAVIALVPGSFKLHRTPGAKTPFIRFLAGNPTGEPDVQGNEEILGYEVFPNALQAIVFRIPEESEPSDG